MQNLRDAVIRSHIQENYPDSKILSWEDPGEHLSFYTAQALQQVRDDWFPLCCYLNSDGKAVYGGRGKVTHTYIEGESGAGKTSRFAMQSIRALSCLADRPSFLIVDIHGELVENLHSHLKENGYQVKILNCDDPSHSDTYNPFTSLVRRCQQSGTIDHEVTSEIRKISEVIQPVLSTKDPVWEQGARSYTNGLILDKFEDLLKGDVPPTSITLYNILQNHYWIREQLSQPSARGDLLQIDHYRLKGTNALSVQKMLAVTNNAEKTRASYFGVIENRYDSFGQPSLYQLSSCSTIDVPAFIENPTAIFIQSGSTQVGDNLVALLLNEIYHTAVRMGRESATKQLPRKIHYFLDEFANCNVSDGPEFIKMLTTSRKFGMHWHILVQCDAQLDRKFDPDIARIVRANCTEIFMGSNDYETMVRFAQSCGMRTVEALGSRVNQQSPHLETVPLITADKLNLIEMGNIYVKANRNPLLLSYIEAFYRCPEFQPVADIRSVYPTNNFDYTTTAFFPDDIPPTLSNREFQVLRYIHKHERVDSFQLNEVFSGRDTELILRRLEKLKLVSEDEDREEVISQTDSETFALLAQKHPDVPEPVHKQVDIPAEPKPKSKPKPKLSKLAREIQATLKQLDLNEDALRDALSEFGCVSADYLNGFLYLAGFRQDLNEDTPFYNAQIVRFEMIESFISCHNFQTKEAWDSAIQAECERALASPIFSETFKEVYKEVVKEICQSLSLTNILDIKKIIGGSPEE